MSILSDITNIALHSANRQVKPSLVARPSVSTPPKVYQHDPYGWDCLSPEHRMPEPTPETPNVRHSTSHTSSVTLFSPETSVHINHDLTSGRRCAVQFRCHSAEYATPISVKKGHFVVVQGDRGIDLGVVVRVIEESDGSTVALSGCVLRFATKSEVDHWNNEIRSDESAAKQFCTERAASLKLPMEILHAEFQFDKKKLTLYYDAKCRVDFVTLLKDLFREYNCRIWMEKIRTSAD